MHMYFYLNVTVLLHVNECSHLCSYLHVYLFLRAYTYIHSYIQFSVHRYAYTEYTDTYTYVNKNAAMLIFI